MKEKQFKEVLESKLFRLFIKERFSNILFVCIGSNKAIGDSIGPMIGNRLIKYKSSDKINIVGTMENPINYINYKKKYSNISIYDTCVISIDSAMCDKDYIGECVVGWGGIEMGKALGKENICKSHINIKVGIAKKTENVINNFKNLLETEKEYVDTLSDSLAVEILNSVTKFV